MAFIHGPVPESFERQVTATAREFERDLRQAWPAVQSGAETRRLSVQDGAQTLVIELEPRRASPGAVRAAAVDRTLPLRAR